MVNPDLSAKKPNIYVSKSRPNGLLLVFYDAEKNNEFGAAPKFTPFHTSAITSTSQRAPLGRDFTATQLLAGADVIYLP